MSQSDVYKMGRWLTFGLIALAAGLVIADRFFTLSPTLIGASIGLVASVIFAFREVVKAYADRLVAELRRTNAKVDENTVKTEAAMVAAEKAAEQVDWQQRATAYKAELDMANRKLALVEGLPDCQDCRLKIRDVLAGKPVERRRTDPPPPHEVQP